MISVTSFFRDNEAVEDGYADGRDRALSETDLPDAAIPQSCPYTFDEMLTRPVAYEPQSKSKRDKR